MHRYDSDGMKDSAEGGSGSIKKVEGCCLFRGKDVEFWSIFIPSPYMPPLSSLFLIIAWEGRVCPDSGVVASETELLDWDMHQLECLLQLGNWEVRDVATPPPRRGLLAKGDWRCG